VRGAVAGAGGADAGNAGEAGSIDPGGIEIAGP
jgi:hypothetical protein